MRDSAGRCDAVGNSIWVDHGPRVATTLEMSEGQLAKLDPGANTRRVNAQLTEAQAARRARFLADADEMERQLVREEALGAQDV